jgi:hypothetical protein
VEPVFKPDAFWKVGIAFMIPQDAGHTECNPMDSKWVPTPRASERIFVSVSFAFYAIIFVFSESWAKYHIYKGIPSDCQTEVSGKNQEMY